MGKYSIDDIVNFAIDGDSVNLTDAINDVLADKKQEAIDVEKIVVAQSLFDTQTTEEEPAKE